MPFAGDLFDVVFKANKRNYLILKSYLAEPARQRHWIFLFATLAVLSLAVALPILALAWSIKHL